jgi:hypothetical protein
MNWRSLSLIAVVTTWTAACDIPFLGKRGDAADTTAAPAPAAARPADTTPPAPVDTAPPPPMAEPAPVASAPRMDEPYTPADTGTVTPGMSRDQVVGLWGQPVAERAAGAWTYLYYRNGCEVS